MEGRPERTIPYHIEAERSVLGAIFIHRDAIISVAPWLHPEEFYREAHAWIYEAQLACYTRREPPDMVTVAAELERRGRLDTVGGMAYLSALVDAVPTAVHVEYYGRIVERCAVLRRLITAGGQIAGIGYEAPEEVDEALSRAEELIFAISQRRVSRDFIPIKEATSEYFDRLSRLRAVHGEVSGVPTGFSDLDKILGGLQKSDLVILAARPTAGKTSMALSIAHSAAMQHGAPVGIFSLEMSKEQLVQRFVAMETEIDSQRLRLGILNDEEFQHVSEAMARLSETAIFIDDTPGIAISELRSKARRLHAEQGIDLLIVDYLQLIQGRRTENRVQEISEISRSLKALARELEVPVIAVSQLSRSVEHRTPHIPVLADLRESGCLTGDTCIYLPDCGRYVTLRELAGETTSVITGLNTQTWRLEKAMVPRAFCTGVKKVYRLTTRLGRAIRATANHRFLTIGGWKRLDEMAGGERIALPRSLPGPNAPSMSNTESDVYWDEVVSIVPDGEEEVFDLTVPGLHNFVANDIIVHNSIEQDADVVMFIYREEMYDENTDKKGIAEVHVAKHRNGPVGTVYLRFFASTTRFVNLEHYREPEEGYP